MVVWNSLDKGPGVTLSFGDLLASSAPTGTYNSGNFCSIRTDSGITGPGKYYWEINALPRVSGTLIDIGVGVSQKGSPPGTNPDEWPLIGSYSTATAEAGTMFRSSNGRIYTGGVPYGPLFNSGSNNIIGVLLDLDDNQLSFQVNGSILPISTTALTPGATYYPIVTLTQGSAFANFGDSAFTYPIPVNFQPYDNYTLLGNTVGVKPCVRRETTQDPVDTVALNQSTFGINKINNKIKSTAGTYKVGDDECAVCRTLINPNDNVSDDFEFEDKQSGRISG